MADNSDMVDIARIESLLSVSFADKRLLIESLTHRSSCRYGAQERLRSNERLEFLGDAVLQLCISDILMRQYPDVAEGDLTRMRASLVNEKTLASIASRRRIGRHLLLGKGEDAAGGRIKKSILADAFEAITGAVYMDRGYAYTREWVGALFSPVLSMHRIRLPLRDHKTRLQELSQKQFGLLPRYELLATSGPEHDKTFRVSVSIGKGFRRRGSGKSRKAAEMCAAQRACVALDKTTQPSLKQR